MFEFESAQNNNNFESKYLTPDVHNVTVKEINAITNKSGSSSLQVTVEDRNAKVCTHSYSLKTELGEGKSQSGWDITKNALVSLAAAAYNIEF